MADEKDKLGQGEVKQGELKPGEVKPDKPKKPEDDVSGKAYDGRLMRRLAGYLGAV